MLHGNLPVYGATRLRLRLRGRQRYTQIMAEGTGSDDGKALTAREGLRMHLRTNG